ncbi:hypothetical protein D3C71_1820560 [compost metagenome]
MGSVIRSWPAVRGRIRWAIDIGRNQLTKAASRYTPGDEENIEQHRNHLAGTARFVQVGELRARIRGFSACLLDELAATPVVDPIPEQRGDDEEQGEKSQTHHRRPIRPHHRYQHRSHGHEYIRRGEVPQGMPPELAIEQPIDS